MNIFFIVGTGRCGTQMLRNILEIWPTVKILPETHFIVPLYKRHGLADISFNQFIDVVDNIYSANGYRFITGILRTAHKDYDTYKAEFREFLLKEGVNGNIRDFSEAFYRYLYGNNCVLGDKTPHYGIHAKVIMSLWPEARFLHIYRDGVDVAYSMTRHLGFKKLVTAGIAPEDIDEFMYGDRMGVMKARDVTVEETLTYWEIALKKTQYALSQIDRDSVMSTRYEDIVRYPSSEISKIARFLGLEKDSNSLKKAVLIPAPFPEYKSKKNYTTQEYERHFNNVRETMEILSYPYINHAKRGWLGWLKELYRGRVYYRLMLNKQIRRVVRFIRTFLAQ